MPEMTEKMETPTGPIIVHSLADAEAALAVAAELGVPVTLRSAPGAARYLGATVFRDMVAEALARHAGAQVTAVFDCGDDPGMALGAVRHGLKVIRLDAPAETRDRVADIAAQAGARLEDEGREPGPALDLLEARDAEAAVRAWLGGGD